MSENKNWVSEGGLLADARKIMDTARANAVRSVDFNRVIMYWNLGKRIFEEEQQGRERAEYGAKMIQNLSDALVPEYGSGFSYRQLAFSRQFYRVYPIVNALRSQLNWTQYRLLIQMDDPQKREYYELESVNHCWTARETERQVNSQLWDIAQVLPSFSDRKIQRLLNALADKGQAKVIGKTKGAKWYLTSNN